MNLVKGRPFISHFIPDFVSVPVVSAYLPITKRVTRSITCTLNACDVCAQWRILQGEVGAGGTQVNVQ